MNSGFSLKDRSAILIMIAVLTVITVLFAGFHGSDAIAAKVDCHQNSPFSCSYSICLAIITMITMVTILLLSSVTFTSSPAFTLELVHSLERPPRR